MASGSWPKSETLSQCFSLVRWFHEHGNDWSGTPAELAFTVATTGEGASWFRSSDDLVKFIETNADMLRDLGLEARVRRETGRTTIDFKSNNLGNQMPTTGPTDLSAHLAAIEARLNQAPPVETVAPAPPPPAPPRPAVDLGARLHDLIDEDSEKVTPYEPTSVNVPEPRAVAKIEEKLPAPARKIGNSPIVLGFVAIVIVLAGLLFVWSRNRTAAAPQASAAPSQAPVGKPVEAPKPAETQATTPPAVVAPQPQPAATPVTTPPVATAENLSPAERQRFDATYAAATTSKQAAPQYDLAMRYAQGAGVAKDNAQAFAWLTIAEANGSAEATSTIPVIQPKLTHDELQRARIAIANAFNAGVVVNKNIVQGYRWLLKAEHDGSPEATVLRKDLETRMFAWQIIQAGGTPPAPDKKNQ